MTKFITITFLLIFILLGWCTWQYAHASDIVARVIAAEACGEGYEGMQAVANVIKNRSRKWRQPIVRVVTSKNQFYGYTASNRDRLYSQCKQIADELAKNIDTLPDITNGALYFRQPSEPIYRWHGEETVRIKGHIFHKERE